MAWHGPAAGCRALEPAPSSRSAAPCTSRAEARRGPAGRSTRASSGTTAAGSSRRGRTQNGTYQPVWAMKPATRRNSAALGSSASQAVGPTAKASDGDDEHGQRDRRGDVDPLDVAADLQRAAEGHEVDGDVGDHRQRRGGDQLGQPLARRRRRGGATSAAPRAGDAASRSMASVRARKARASRAPKPAAAVRARRR